jgi:hypothetical protein
MGQRTLKCLMLAMVMSVPVALISQNLNRLITDPRLNREVLIGYCDREGFMTGEMGEPFHVFYDEYIPDEGMIERLRPLLKGIKVLVILGSWCSDSQEQVPRFYKILDHCGFDDKNLTMVCVNRDKLAGEIDIRPYAIEKVPTFIFYRKGKDLGRIIETPQTSMEEDMVGILLR